MSKSAPPLAAVPFGAHESGLTRQQELASALESGQVFRFQGMIGAMTPIFEKKTAMSPEESHKGKYFRNRDYDSKIRFGPF